MYNGFGGDTRAIPSPVPLVAQMLPRRIGVRRTMEEERVEEGRRAYASKAARGERGWGLGAWRGRKR